MSHTHDFEATIANEDALVTALKRMGVPEECIEVHKTPVRLRTYHSNENKVAHVVVRRNLRGNFRDYTSDIGWERKDDGTYVAHIDSYDYGNGIFAADDVWQQKLYTYCLVETSKIEMVNNGYEPVESLDDKGRIVLSGIAKKFDAPKSKYATKTIKSSSK
jgi:hypothetical protein